jgi:hypothetical protein
LTRQYVQNQIDIVKRDILADIREQRAHLEGSLNVMREQHKNLLESTNTELGRMRMDQQKTERRYDVRLSDVERITGKAKMFNGPEGGE